MASGWVKSLQCKSKAVDDVVPRHRKPHNSHHSASCRETVQSLKDVVDPTRQSKPGRSKQPEISKYRNSQRPVSRKSGPVSSQPVSGDSVRFSRSGSETCFPALTELPEGHPSRNVVEIIFQTSWSPNIFSGRVEMVFKVQHLSRSVTRFEDYREMVKSRAEGGGASGKVTALDCGGEDHTRCLADGNEVLRFMCLGSMNGGAYDGGAWALKGAKIVSFAGSGEAHNSAGGGRGRRAMLVCRVIAGRCCKQLGFESLVKGRVGYDSESGDNGELIVFDSRAVLPCFLIIYRL